MLFNEKYMSSKALLTYSIPKFYKNESIEIQTNSYK